MKLAKALGALALSGMAFGAAQLAAAGGTTPIQDLALVEETTSPALPDARIPPDDLPYDGSIRPHRPFRPYEPIRPHRPFRPYGPIRPFRPIRPYEPFDPFGWPREHRRFEAPPEGDLPMPVVRLGEPR
ncbi:hypothetical protein WME76_30525 [Sorangium sp. So ce119]|uniref:hypothetical protein n=1 Tax=Sorangium sp. So ce119 TaxID=3133279 RepID=UPI003F62A090